MFFIKNNVVSQRDYRADIDGLRAIAVLAVLLFHALPTHIPGGYVGVDIFFVISGYLISKHIIQEIVKNTFSFLYFYERRIKRIFPVLFLVLLFTLGAGWFLFLPEDYKKLGLHSIAGVSFLSNFLLWHESGYFDPVSEQKPLLHLWSLGIEEQFYLIWPIMIWLTIKYKRGLIFSIVMMTILSFGANIYFAEKDSVNDFFSPLTRFWELMIGALIAYQELHHHKKIPTIRSHLYSIVGFLGLMITIAFFNSNLKYPSFYGLIPTLSCAILIKSGEQAFINRYLLSFPILGVIGLISYPLYLWHWPLFAIVNNLTNSRPSLIVVSMTMALSFLMAFLSWNFIEKPIRFSLSSKIKTQEDRILFLMTSFGFMIILALLSSLILLNNGFDSRLKKVSQEYRDSLEPMTIEIASHVNNMICKDLFSSFSDTAHCSVNNLKQTRFAVLGDSHAEHFAHGLLGSSTQDDGWMLLTQSGCPAIANVSVLEGRINSKCKEFNRAAFEVIQNHPEIEIVFLSSMITPYVMTHYSQYRRDGKFVLSSDNIKGSPKDLYYLGLSETIKKLHNMGKEVVLIRDNPEMPFDIESCTIGTAMRVFLTHWNGCSISRLDYEKRNIIAKDIFNRLKSQFDYVKILDNTNLFCDDQRCSPFHNGRSYYHDIDHLSVFGSKVVSKIILNWLIDNQVHLSDQSVTWAHSPNS